MDEEYDEFADEFFDEATLAIADRVEQSHISLTQQTSAAPPSLKRHELAKPARGVRAGVGASNDPQGGSRIIAGRGRVAQYRPPTFGGSHLAPRPVGAVGAPLPVTAPFKPPALLAGASTSNKDEEYYPDVGVSEDGLYKIVGSEGGAAAEGKEAKPRGNGHAESSTGREQAPAVRGQQFQRPALPPPRQDPQLQDKADQSGLGNRKAWARSISMGPSQSASHPQSHLRDVSNGRMLGTTVLAQTRMSAVAGPSGFSAGGMRLPASQGLIGSQGSSSSFKRTNSAGESARRSAIESAMGLLPQVKEEAASAIPVPAVETGSPSVTGGMDVDQHTPAAVSPGPPARNLAAVDEAAQALRLEMEQMRQQVAQLERDKAEAERKAKEAQADVWKYQGEAKIIRGKFEEKEKAHVTLAESMKKKVDVMQEALAKQQAEHQRDLDGLNTVNAFKTHNLLTSTSKRFPSSQRSALRNGSATPSRPHFAIPQGTPSRSPSRNNFNRSPSKLGMVRSPVKMGGTGAILPPAAPMFVDSFKTPMKLSKKGSKAVSKSDVEVATTPVGFSSMAQAFDVNSLGRGAKKQKVRQELSDLRRDRLPEDSSSPDMDNGDTAMEMVELPFLDIATYPVHDRGDALLSSNDCTMDQVDLDHEDAWQMVVHLVLTHSFLGQADSSAAEQEGAESPEQEPTLTLHKIMHYEPTQEGPAHDTVARKHIALCRTVLNLCGVMAGQASSLTSDMISALWSVCGLFANARDMDTVLSLLDLMRLIFGISSDHAAEGTVVANTADLLSCLTEPSLAQLLGFVFDMSGFENATTKGKERAKLSPLAIEEEAMLSYIDLLALACFDAEWIPENIIKFAASVWGVTGVLRSTATTGLHHACVDLIGCIAADTHPQTFRWLLSDPDSDGPTPTRVPFIAALCDLLMPAAPASPSEVLLSVKVLGVISNLAQMDRDAAFLLGQNYHLIPALVRGLEQASDGLWGISADPAQVDHHMTAIIPALTLLHYLVFPPLSDDPEAPAGLDLAGRLQASSGIRELVGLHHVFVTALGRISYAETDILTGWSEVDLRSMQDLAQDLLDVVVIGPEGDAIYEIYVSDKLPELEESIDAEDEEILAAMPRDDDMDMS